MDYEYMIDFLNENTQLDFLMYSIDVIGIDEGVMDILISMKNAMVNFFKKVGEFFSNMIRRITNKENVSATKGELEAKAIISKTDENCNIKLEKMPEVANKIEQVNDKSMERSATIRNAATNNPNKKPTYSKAKKILSKEPEKSKPEKITLSAVFLKDQYIDEILKDSGRIFSSIQSINSTVSMLNSKNYTDKIRSDFKDNFAFKYHPDIVWKISGKLFYEKPNKELYDITYTDSPRELLKIVSNKLITAKRKNNILSLDIKNGNKMLDESQKIIDSLELDKMDIGFGYFYDKDKDQWKEYMDNKNDNSDDFTFQYKDVDKEDIKKMQEFHYNHLKKSFKEETQCYRDAMNCFKITLSEISEEINRCNQYITVIKSNM